jgi:serine/threonine-protein kinase
VEDSRIDRIAELFDRALEMPPAQRVAFLDDACAGDVALRAELDSLLEADESASDYFDNLAAGVVGPAYGSLSDNARIEPDPTLLPRLQEALGEAYRIERELGGGAMSRVFLAEEVKLARKVVVKVLPPELAASVSTERFRREIQLVAKLQHPHIVPLFTSDSTSSLLWYTMPAVAGESLRDRIARDGSLPLADARKIWRDILDALAYAHASGVVHRDIKPANILLSGRNALVTDFGIARAIENAVGNAETTAAGLAIGTPAYMAPEQIAADDEVDHRADIYSSALVMHEMLEGRKPFEGRSAREQMLARLSKEPPAIARGDCPADLSDLVRICMNKDPAARPESAEAVLTRLDLIPAAGAPKYFRRSRQRLVAYGVGAAAFVSAIAYGAIRLADKSISATVAPATASIAVLPLRDVSADPGNAAIADGMTEELNATLARAGNMRVAASTSVHALINRQLGIRQIAESLHVSHVLEGAIQREGPRLRMQVRLIDAADGSTRWSETFDREISDVFALQDDIASAVALAIDARVAASPHNVKPRRYTANIQAYDWYLQGMNTLLLLRTDSGRHRGLEYFQRAVDADSGFAAAYAGMSWIHLSESGLTPGNHLQAFRQAREAALKAIQLDDSLPQAYSALGWALSAIGPAGDLTAAEAALKRAVALDPAVYRGYEGLARVYALERRPVEQLTAAKLGLEVAPFSLAAMREMSLALYANGRCDEALEMLRPLTTLSPPASVAGVIRGQCFAVKGMWPQAIAEYRWAMKVGGARTALGLLGHALARSGQTAEAKEILADLIAKRKDSHGAFGIAVIYAGLRDYDNAFKWLAKSEDEGSSRVYIMGPLFADLQSDPRFDRIVRPRPH